MSTIHSNTSDEIEPYRVLFPIGVTAALIAILMWAFFSLGWIKFYPRTIHATLFYFGFFYAFIAGFLMTAVPRMTGTKSASWMEISVHVFLIMMQITLGIRNQVDIQIYLAFAQISFLVVFLAQRLLEVKKIPFPGFYFLLPAFFWAMFGLVRFALNFDTSLSKLFLFSGEAFVLNLICGLGSRLIPAISRLPNVSTPDIAQVQGNKLVYLLSALILNLGYILNLLGHYRISNLVLLIAIGFIVVYYFKIFQMPTQLGVLGVGLKLSTLFIVLSKALAYLEVGNRLATDHIMYLGGMLLMTLLIGMRVMLAHGGRSLDYEIKSPLVIGFITLVLLSTVGRFVMGGDLTSPWFALAIWLLIVATLVWLIKFFLVTFKNQKY